MILFSEKQLTNLTYHESLSEVEEWLKLLVDVQDLKDEKPYYLHIDHMQVFQEKYGYSLLSVYHRVYLQKG